MKSKRVFPNYNAILPQLQCSNNWSKNIFSMVLKEKCKNVIFKDQRCTLNENNKSMSIT
jgi:hypothetical protein